MITTESMLNNEYLRASIILVGSILFAYIVRLFLNKYISKLTARTQTDLDDKIFDAVKGPLVVIIIVAGFYISLQSLSVVASYKNWLDRIYIVITIIIVALLVTKLLSLLITSWFKVQKKFEKTPKLLTKIVNVVIYLIAFLMILDVFSIEITPLLATVGLGGLAIGLALQATLSNFFAGLHILSDKPIVIGDFIEIPEANITGFVEDIGWRSTRIRTLPNQVIIVPNTKLAESIIINDSLPEEEIAALVQVGVAYTSDLRKVERVTIEVAREIQKTVQGAVKTFEPFIRFHTFGDSNINFSVILRVEKFVDRHLVIHEFIKALKERYDKEKIEISWPVRKIYNAG